MSVKDVANCRYLQHHRIALELVDLYRGNLSKSYHGLHSLSDCLRETSSPSSAEDALNLWESRSAKAIVELVILGKGYDSPSQFFSVD